MYNMNNTSFAVDITEKFNKLEEDNVLRKHQLMVVEYLKTRNGLLVQHDLGTGKSLIAAAIIANNCDRQVIFLSPGTLKANMNKTLETYIKAKNIECPNTYKFITMNASNMIVQVHKIVDDLIQYDTASKLNLDNKVIIIDEAHNFFNGITNGSENAIGLYEAIMRSTAKVVFLTGTPIVNHPFELVPCYNMIARSEILPPIWDDFSMYFIDLKNKKIKNKAKFQNRIVGLTSYYGAYYNKGEKSYDDFPQKLPIIVHTIPMSNYQFELYSVARNLELDESHAGKKEAVRMQKPKGIFSTSYKRLSRQVSNIAFPKHATSIEGKKITLVPDKVDDKDLMDKNLSPKWHKMLSVINSSKGKQLVYSSFVENAGINMFARLLELNGWSEYDDDSDDKKYIIVSGMVETNKRNTLVELFNDDNNANGEIISLILISSAGAEGLDLRAIRHIHIMEPYWNWARIEQVIGRGYRYRSHIQLPKKERTLQVHMYLSCYPKSAKSRLTSTEETTEVLLYNNSKDMYDIIGTFYKAMAEAAVDCAVHNKSTILNCRLCTPTNEILFLNDIEKDMKMRSPCRPMVKEKIKAKEIIIGNRKFAWYLNNDEIVILDENPNLGGYIELKRNHPLYADLHDKISEIVFK